MTTTIANFKTGIGNFVLFTPALQAIASMDSTGKIDLCIDMDWMDYRRQSVVQLAANLPFIDRVLGFPADVVPRANEYKTWFWSYWTTSGETLLYFKSKKDFELARWNQKSVHETEFYMESTRRAYGYTGPTPKQMVIPGTDPIIDAGERKIIALCNGSFGRLGAIKKWGGFPDVARTIKDLYRDEVYLVLVGVKDELQGVDCFDVDYTGQLDLLQTAKVIEQTDLMVTTDTGNMHIADALGTPLVVLWGGSVLGKNRPINSMSNTIHLGYPCQPCINTNAFQNCTDMRCMNDITTGEVMYRVRQFMSKGRFTDGNA